MISTVPAQPSLSSSLCCLVGCSATLKDFLLVANKGTTTSTQIPDDVISCHFIASEFRHIQENVNQIMVFR